MTPEFLDATMVAAIKKDEALLARELLQRGVPANNSLLSGSTPLEIAASAGASKVVRELLASRANPNISGRNGSSPLEEASLKGFAPVTELLLEGGALVNRVNGGSGTTALYSAASFGKEEVADMLLERGANPNLCGSSLRSPYQAAVDNGYRQLAMQIQKHGGSAKCEAGK